MKTIADRLNAVKQVKEDIKTAIEKKGVDMEGIPFTEYAGKVEGLGPKEIIPLEVTENGTYTAKEGEAFNPVTVNTLEVWDALAGNPEFVLDKFRRSDVVINLSQFITNVRYFSFLTAHYANTTLKHLTINCPNQVTQAFSFVTALRDNCITHLTINVDVSLVTNFSCFIRYLEAVEIIDGTPLNWSSATSGTPQNFNRCFKLREIRFAVESLPLQVEFSDCSELSNESINSIINGLMYLENTQTIKFHNTVGKKLTDEQKSVIALKGWTLAY